MADVIELYGLSVPVDLRTDEFLYDETISMNGTQFPMDMRVDETVYTDPHSIFGMQAPYDLRYDEVVYPDVLGIYGVATPTDPHIHFFGTETLTEIAPGAGLRDNGDRVRFPYDQFTAATSIDKGTYLSFSDVAALASNPRVQVLYNGPAAIAGIIVDSIYEIDCE